ncbi:MAG: hypothetical protein DRQ61_05660 [Gammaproteobacteria bacterium]|nr:MAG: hypothetical protein DRQ56_09450 [Gammaproteobacteria bacterium]RLA22738.1 MAG: hypothetical protein DRQ61_05660 [Gammaproteobacteria bacterium]
MLRWISAIFFVLLGLSVQAEIYKWKGSDGKVHFSDRDPKHSAEQIILKSSISEDKIEQARKESKEFVGRQQRKAAFQKEETARLKKHTREKELKLAKKENYCARAKKELRLLNMGVPVYRTDKTGERSYLGDSQRESEINEWSRNVRKYCE